MRRHMRRRVLYNERKHGRKINHGGDVAAAIPRVRFAAMIAVGFARGAELGGIPQVPENPLGEVGVELLDIAFVL